MTWYLPGTVAALQLKQRVDSANLKIQGNPGEDAAGPRYGANVPSYRVQLHMKKRELDNRHRTCSLRRCRALTAGLSGSLIAGKLQHDIKTKTAKRSIKQG